VAEHGLAVGHALGLDAGQLTALRLGAYLHDLGKVRVPQELLNKPGKLTAEEFGVVKMHPVWGLDCWPRSIPLGTSSPSSAGTMRSTTGAATPTA
jgi:response regulator RpfG family c-di-GMP phosphodiesterase